MKKGKRKKETKIERSWNKGETEKRGRRYNKVKGAIELEREEREIKWKKWEG